MWLDEVARYIASKGHGTFGDDGTITVDFKPEEPDEVIVLRAYAGPDQPLHWDGEERRFQMTVRGWDATATQERAEAAYSDLHGLCESVLDSTRYLLVRALQTPESIGRDGRGRCEVVCNFAVTKDR